MAMIDSIKKLYYGIPKIRLDQPKQSERDTTTAATATLFLIHLKGREVAFESHTHTFGTYPRTDG